MAINDSYSYFPSIPFVLKSKLLSESCSNNLDTYMSDQRENLLAISLIVLHLLISKLGILKLTRSPKSILSRSIFKRKLDKGKIWGSKFYY